MFTLTAALNIGLSRGTAGIGVCRLMVCGLDDMSMVCGGVVLGLYNVGVQVTIRTITILTDML